LPSKAYSHDLILHTHINAVLYQKAYLYIGYGDPQEGFCFRFFLFSCYLFQLFC